MERDFALCDDCISIYLYSNGEFMCHKELSQLTHTANGMVSIDIPKKCISNHVKVGCCLELSHAIYTVENNKLRLISEEIFRPFDEGVK